MVKTTKIQGGAEYALVPARLKEFREQNPRALVETKPTVQDDGGVIFSARILVDKANKNSAEATGTAMYNANEMKKSKAFEKLETVSVGRALALLGYLNNGQVATSEEMTEFNEFRDDKIEHLIDQINACNDIDELKELFVNAGSLIAESRIIEAKDAKKKELTDASNQSTSK